METEELGIFAGHLRPAAENAMRDADTVSFGVRTVTADSTRGLLVNGQEVKLKLLKDSGFNCVRTAHNPPSAALLEACDSIGMYVFDEAFDAWGIAKQPGDYSQYFRDHWKEDMDAFIKRDRNHPCVLLWSTGNEIPERGGLNNGYQLAMELAEYVRQLDHTRLVSNGLCTYWSGLYVVGYNYPLAPLRLRGNRQLCA